MAFQCRSYDGLDGIVGKNKAAEGFRPSAAPVLYRMWYSVNKHCDQRPYPRAGKIIDRQ